MVRYYVKTDSNFIDVHTGINFLNWITLREKCRNTEFFLVRILLYSDWIQENTDQKKLRIWTIFKQCKEEIIRKIRKKQRLNKDDLIRLALDYQQKYDINLDKISKELAELRKSYNKLESDLAITKAVNESLRNQILTLERQCWSNAQYSRRET